MGDGWRYDGGEPHQLTEVTAALDAQDFSHIPCARLCNHNSATSCKLLDIIQLTFAEYKWWFIIIWLKLSWIYVVPCYLAFNPDAKRIAACVPGVRAGLVQWSSGPTHPCPAQQLQESASLVISCALVEILQTEPRYLKLGKNSKVFIRQQVLICFRFIAVLLVLSRIMWLLRNFE